jgi:HD-GYP domain-containing protein (c-di-GMP phosphodiesterase class II)
MLKWIDIGQLRLGMFICEQGGQWLDNPFWRSKFLLKNPEDLQLIKNSGIKRICIDSSKGLDVAAVIPAKTATLSVAPAPKPLAPAVLNVSMDEELKRAARICANGKDAVASMFQEVRMGNAVDVDNVAPLVEEISASVARNPGALISLARLKTKDDYTYMHSVAVCGLMVVLARQLQLDEAQTRSAGLAGLLHDMGKATSPPDILNKPGKLTDQEFAVMKQHPVAGHAMLLEARGADTIALDVCLHHHEKFDGSGYPEKLSGDGISLFAKMGAVCDVYDAVTSERPYNKGWDPAEAIRRMAEWQGHFDPKILQAFIKSLGIYPVGSLVRLESGKLAVVLEQTKKSLTTPRVKVFFSTKSRAHLMPEVLDLSRPHCADKIAGREAAETWGLGNLDELWSNIAPPAAEQSKSK